MPVVGLKLYGVVVAVDFKITEYEGDKFIRLDCKVSDGTAIFPVGRRYKYAEASTIPKLATGDPVVIEKITQVKSEFGQINAIIGQIRKFAG